MNSEYYVTRERVEKRAKGKTVLTSDIRSIIITKLNDINRRAVTGEVTLEEAHSATLALRDMSYILNANNGIVSRAWRAFVHTVDWYDVITKLREYDDENDTQHYKKLIDIVIEQRQGELTPLYFFPQHAREDYSSGASILSQEKMRAAKIVNRYKQFFGIP